MNSKNKILSSLLIFLLLTSTSIYFLDILVFHRPNIGLISKSYEEKMEYIDSYKFAIFNYIEDSVKANSTVLFFYYSLYILAKPFLYPKIQSSYRRYTNDDNLLIFLQHNIINYILIYFDQHHLTSNTILFTKIEYAPEIYLLKINRSTL